MYQALIDWDLAESVRSLKRAISDEPDSVVLDNVNIGQQVHPAQIHEGEEFDFVVSNGTKGVIYRNHGRLVIQ